MTIAILRKAPGQKIPRPFNRACSEAEARELLAHWMHNTCGCTSKLVTMRNLDTERTVLEHAGSKFYAFTEE